MVNILKSKFLAFVDFLHLKIFGHQIGDNMKTFLGHLSWSFSGGIITSIIMMVINILGGRLMGPNEYGKYNLLITLSQFIMIPILFGLDTSSIIAISNSKKNQEKKDNISSTLYFVLFSSLLLSVLYIVFFKYISNKFSIETTFLSITFIFAILTGLKTIFESFIKGLHLFRYQFYGRIIEIFTVCLFFLLFFIFENKHNYFFYVLSLTTGIIILIIYYFKKTKHFLTDFNLEFLKKQISLGKFLLLGTILGICFNSIDKLIIAKYLSLTELGIYGAYFTVSVNLVGQLTQMFINVFLPSISNINDSFFIKKIDRLYLLFFTPILIGIMGIVFLAITLFGDKYGINYGFIISFSLLSTLQIYLSINSNIIITISKKTYKKYLFFNNFVNLIHLIIYGLVLYLQLTSIQLIVNLYIINVIILIYIQKILIKSSFKDKIQ